MDDKTFDNLSEFTRKLSFPQGLSDDQIIRGVGKGFKGTDRLAAIGSLITHRISRGTKPTHRFSSTENFVNCGKKLTAKLSSQERFYFFVLLMYGWHFDPTPDTYEINAVAEVLDISEKELNSIKFFFRQTAPYSDLNNSVYFVSSKSNPLIAARGVNVHFSLREENEIHYLKYFKDRELFLAKIFTTQRPANSITEIVSEKQLNIISGADNACGIYTHSFSDLIKSVERFQPFQSVKCEAGPNTPNIHLDATLSKISIKGSSSPLSPINYFQPILDWLDLYGIHGAEALDIEIALDYFNSYTLKFLLNLCNSCKTLASKGRDVTISWYYSDEDIFDFGKQLQDLYGQKFKLINTQNKAGALL